MLKVVKSKARGKKYAVLVGNRTVNFGQAGASDYTINKDIARRNRYLLRHYKREKWDDITTPGAWSAYLLWNKPTLEARARNMAKVFKVKIDVSNIL